MTLNIDPQLLLAQATSETSKVKKGQQDKQQLQKTTQQFEAIFIQQIFKEMRNTIPDSGLLPRSNADDIYMQLQDMEAAKVMAERGGIGLTELMLESIQKKEQN